jgi:hypothetical protein
MFLTLVDGICTAYLQTGCFGEAFCDIIFQIASLTHSLIVDILKGITVFVAVNLKSRTIGIYTQNGTCIGAGNTALAVAEPILFGQVQS